LFNAAYDLPAEDPAEKSQQNAAPFKREPVPDLPRKLPTGSSGMEPAVATGFCGLMLDAGAWAFARDKSGDFFPALTPICMVASAILTTISVVLFGLIWIRHRRDARSR
jgi:hypothetical protein